MTKEKECLNCGQSFKPYRSHQKFCDSKGKGVCGLEYRKKLKEEQTKPKEEPAKEHEIIVNNEDEMKQYHDENDQVYNDDDVNRLETLETQHLEDDLEACKQEEDEIIVETLKNEGLEDDLEEVNDDDENDPVYEDDEQEENILETTRTEGIEQKQEEPIHDESNDDENEEEEVFDLSKHLSTQPTKPKEETISEEEEQEEPPLDNDDFDQELLEEIEENKNKNLSISRDLETDAVKVMMAPHKAAKVSISFLSAINDLALPFLHKKASFTKSEENHLKNLARLSKQKELDKFSDQDRILLAKWNEHEAYKELVPLDEDEKEDLAIPLEELFKSTDGKGMSPFWALIIVLMTILSSRLVPVGQAYAERGKLKKLEQDV